MVNKEKKAGDDRNFTTKNGTKILKTTFSKRYGLKGQLEHKPSFLICMTQGWIADSPWHQWPFLQTCSKAPSIFFNTFHHPFSTHSIFFWNTSVTIFVIFFLLTFLALEVLHLSGSWTKHLSSIILNSYQIPCTFRETCKSGSLLLSANLLALFYIVLSDT